MEDKASSLKIDFDFSSIDLPALFSSISVVFVSELSKRFSSFFNIPLYFSLSNSKVTSTIVNLEKILS